MTGIYDKLPYGEVQAEMSSAAFERLQMLIGDKDIKPVEGESVVESIVSVTASPASRELLLETEVDIFVPIFSNIGHVLVEHDRLPDYLLDSLSRLAEVIEVKRVCSTPATRQMTMTFEAIKLLAAEYWRSLEAERLSFEPFDVVTVCVPDIGTVSVHMEYDAEIERWKLGYRFTEARSYEYHGGYAYRIVDGNLFTDPTGTEGDTSNVTSGCYLPSRLDMTVFEEPILA